MAIRNANAEGTRDPSGRPGPLYWQLNPEYHLHARLDTATAMIHGSGTILLRNTSPAPLEELVLRLDQNRFRKEVRGGEPTRGIILTSLAVDGQELGIGVNEGTPGVSGEETIAAQLALPDPLLPGRSLRIEMTWEYEVPLDEGSNALRQGRWGNSVFQIAQWYPRVAMFDDLAGWDVSEHDGDLEFYNPFGTFDVVLDLPSGWLVGATGALTNPADVLSSRVLGRLDLAAAGDTTLFVVPPEERGEGTADSGSGLLSWRFRADSVSDFAWGASPDYAWSVTSETLQGTGRVLVHALMTPRHEWFLSEATVEAAEVLRILSDRVMPYAWKQHTLLDGPEGAMEYPMLTMSHGGVIGHEVTHQWFPMMVGSDETRFAFLDEGFASSPLTRSLDSSWVAQKPERATMEPILLPDDIRTLRPFAGMYGYGRGSRMFRTLAERVGKEEFLRAISAYAMDWRFKHPSPWDFMASMERSLGLDLTDFWLTWLFSTDAIEEGSR